MKNIFNFKDLCNYRIVHKPTEGGNVEVLRIFKKHSSVAGRKDLVSLPLRGKVAALPTDE
jgi:hypothetical protein